MYKVLVQKAALVETHSQEQPIKNPHQKLCPPSVRLLYPVVNKEVEQQFLERGVTL
jgi:hypothetical protein